VVGEAPDAAGFFWQAALSGYGIQTAPAVGRLTAALVTGANPRVTVDELAAIAPGRLLAN
jgi:D-arginine dehydrogenase